MKSYNSPTTGDNDALPVIQAALQKVDLLPDEQLVDLGYMEAQRLVDSQEDYGIDLVGPIQVNSHRQFRDGGGFDMSHFLIDWQAQHAVCPNGKI